MTEAQSVSASGTQTTSGQSSGIGADNNAQSGNVTGLTTAQLQGALPGGFSNTVWGTGTDLFPYFLWQYPGAPPQAVSGFAESSADNPAAGAQVAIYTGGNLLTGSTVSSGANGYFYELLAPGTITASTKLGETITLSGAPNATGVTYTDQPVLSGGSVQNFNVADGSIVATTADATLSAVQSDANATLGAGASVFQQVNHPFADIRATNPGGFTVDHSPTS